MYFCRSAFIVALLTFTFGYGKKYEPDWNDLDLRPLPDWYDEAKVGIFVTWGLYSVVGFNSEWFWAQWKSPKYMIPSSVKYMKDNYPPSFTYADFAKSFKAELFDPDAWVDLFAKSGGKYVVFTTKHHGGYCMWDTKYSFNWDSVDVGPNKDLTSMYVNSLRKRTNLRVGLYKSLLEWFHPLYLQDKENGFRNSTFPPAKTMPEWYEIVEKFKPDVVWADGDWTALDSYYKTPEFIAWLYNESPVKDSVVINDRWGNNTRCKHGGFWNCQDKFNPGQLVGHKWENVMSVDTKSWGYIRNHELTDIMTPGHLIKEIITTVSYGGNILISVGPMPDGTIPIICQERLLQMGEWLQINGEAIYGTKMWSHQNDSMTPNVWYTAKKNPSTASIDVFALFTEWPKSDTMTLAYPRPTADTSVTLLGYQKGKFTYSIKPEVVIITFPRINFNDMPCKWAWVLKFTNLMNQEIKTIDTKD